MSMRDKINIYRTWMPALLCLALSFVATLCALAAPPSREAGYDAWLRYDPIDDGAARLAYDRLPAVVVALDGSPVISSAREELLGGVRRMLGRTLRVQSRLPQEDAVVMGKLDAVRSAFPALNPRVQLKA